MKIQAPHLVVIKEGIDQVLAANPDLVQKYETGQFDRADKVKDLQMRFCWDLFYMAKDHYPPSLIKSLYEYLNDTHIYTGLKFICPRVTRKY